MLQLLNNKYLLYFLSFGILFSYFVGFIIGENSAGAGGYNGDLQHTWKNLQTFKNNSFLHAIEITGKSDSHLNNENYFQGTRPPLLYIIQSLNPLNFSIKSYLINVFFLSLFAYILFYQVIKLYFIDLKKIYIFSLSCILLLSPYFRTSSYWGLEENYAIISALITAIFFNNLIKKKILHKKNIFLIIFFSSLTVYFDQKYLIIPLICFFWILKSTSKSKMFTFFTYFIFSLPMIYLIKIWGNLLPTVDSIGRNVGKIFYFENIGYVVMLLGFYIFPFLLFKKNFKFNFKLNKFYVFFTILYLIYFIFFYDLSNEIYLGKGFIFKISVILFDNITIQKTFLLFFIIIGIFIIKNFIDLNKFNLIIVSYFILLSVFIWPFFQEYLDPLFLILILLFSVNRFKISNFGCNFILIYFLFLLISSNIYFYEINLNFFNLQN